MDKDNKSNDKNKSGTGAIISGINSTFLGAYSLHISQGSVVGTTIGLVVLSAGIILLLTETITKLQIKKEASKKHKRYGEYSNTNLRNKNNNGRRY